MFDRDLPSVFSLSPPLTAQEAQTVTQKITKTLNQTQCDTLIKMLDLSSIVDASSEPLSIVFEHLYAPFLPSDAVIPASTSSTAPTSP